MRAACSCCTRDVIKVENLDTFDATVQRWFADVEKAAAEAAVGLAREAFDQLLETSPQFSGDFVANWKVSKSPGDPGFEVDAVGGFNRAAPYKMGDSPAMSYARANAKWPKIKLGESVYLSNSAKHDEPYAFKIERGQINLRDVNKGAAHVVSRAVLHTSFTYQNIGPVQLDWLRKMGV